MFFMKSEVLHIDFEYSWCMETGKILNPIGLLTFGAISETNVTWSMELYLFYNYQHTYIHVLKLIYFSKTSIWRFLVWVVT